MKQLPKVIATSVVRSVEQGESHGGAYLVDLETGEARQVVDWNTIAINWEGRGNNRGLRGVAFYQGNVYIAASDRIFVYDRKFNIVKSFTNQYLKFCHEIYIVDTRLFITSTGFDSLLIYDLDREKFTRGYCIRPVAAGATLGVAAFNPESETGPKPGDSVHLNNVVYDGEKLIICGTGLQNLLFIVGDRPVLGPPVPRGTHNASLYNDGVLVNDTKSDRIAYFGMSGDLIKSVPIPRYDESRLLMSDIPNDHARQAFARGLCVVENGIVIGGSSPSTITVYDLENEKIIKSINLTMDVRNCVHGLEIWPY